jgi:hypothetical protein
MLWYVKVQVQSTLLGVGGREQLNKIIKYLILKH